MTQKYYHNDYKKLLNVDQTRTASEKLLDRAIGGVRSPTQVKEEKAPEKKVKEQASSLTHLEVLTKLTKNLGSNNQAIKLLKPLNILKKCLQDQSFIMSPEINKEEIWVDLFEKVVVIDEKMIGNYGEILPVNQCLFEIFTLLLPLLKKIEKNEDNTVKREDNDQIVKKEAQQITPVIIDRCEMQIMYLKMFTDDNFVFNKTLLEFKKRFIGHFQEFAKQQSQQQFKQLLEYLSALLLKMFKLPFKKYEWIKSSLSQFFKEFNIQYKQLLPEDLLSKYLQAYNEFISQKSGHSGGEDVNIFGKSRGGKITSIQVANNDGFDTWTSKQ